ncbi:MAG TPA: VWA domain-containing protein [Thermoanaerobaculia bacterium]|nr:VWA domain-containing protein [Thermoanaerobaculia bacterium]
MRPFSALPYTRLPVTTFLLALLALLPLGVPPTGAGEPVRLTMILRDEAGAVVGAGRPVFGPVEIEVAVQPAGLRFGRLELYIDGRRAGVLEAPPYRLLVDTGQRNAEHRFEAVAFGGAGEALAAASLRSGRVEADLDVEVRLQHLYLTALRGGLPVAGLGSEDFSIYDQGVLQRVATCDSGDLPFSAALLLDASASMEGGRLRAALAGARAFAAALQRLDEAKLLLFSDRLRLESPFTAVPAVLELGLQGVVAGGGTMLNDALYLAIKRLESRPGRRVVVLLSDGVDVESVLPMSWVRQALRASQVVVYWLRLPTGDPEGARRFTVWRNAEGHRREAEELRAAVLESGGRIEQLGRIEQVESKLAGVAAELRSQYALSFYPSASLGHGRWHDLRVTARGRDLRLRAQSGYLER